MKSKPLFSLVLSMVIFGTVGIFRRYLPFSSEMIAFSRGMIGFLFLAGFLWLKKQQFDFSKIKKSFPILCLSGALMGFNWILLFEAYNYTSVAVATLCYYMAPVFVIAVSPFLFKEKIGKKRIFCIAAAVLGMVLVSEPGNIGFDGASQLPGVLLGLGAAVLYASVVLLNKKNADVPPFEKTVVQLGSAAAVLLPYTAITGGFSFVEAKPAAFLLLAAVGIIHTGLAYVLYFGSIGALSAQTTALLSYIDPAVAVILSFAILGE